MIGRALQDPHQIRIRIEAMAAHLVKHGFETVGKGDQSRQLEGPCPPFDGMNGAKHRVDGFIVMRPGMHLREAFGQRFQQFFGFFKEHVANRNLLAHLTLSPP